MTMKFRFMAILRKYKNINLFSQLSISVFTRLITVKMMYNKMILKMFARLRTVSLQNEINGFYISVK